MLCSAWPLCDEHIHICFRLPSAGQQHRQDQAHGGCSGSPNHDPCAAALREELRSMLTGDACSLPAYDGLMPLRLPQDSGVQLGIVWVCELAYGDSAMPSACSMHSLTCSAVL